MTFKLVSKQLTELKLAACKLNCVYAAGFNINPIKIKNSW